MAKVIINRNRCEGKAICTKVCPENVFEMKEPESVPFLVGLKLKFRGGKQAFAVREEACNVCMKCVEACPEKSIHIQP